jgi:hypothetical protein
VPRLPSVPGELAGAIRRGKAEGRLGPEHRLDVARARLLVTMLVDEATPRSAIAALDRRLDVILSRLGFVADATGPTELDDWLAGPAGGRDRPSSARARRAPLATVHARSRARTARRPLAVPRRRRDGRATER